MARRGAIDRLEEPVRATVDKLIHEGHTTVAISEHLAGLGTPAGLAAAIAALAIDLNDFVKKAGDTMTGNLTISSDAPIVWLEETNAPATIPTRVRFVLNNGNLAINTYRMDNGIPKFVSQDYVVFRNASGAALHQFLIGGDEKMRVDTDGIRITADFPRVDLIEADSTSTFNKARLVQQGDIFRIETPGISSDYLIAKDASGATSHTWRLGNDVKMLINATGLRLSDSNAATDAEVVAQVEFYRGANAKRVGRIGFPNAGHEHLNIQNETTDGDIRFIFGATVAGRFDADGGAVIGLPTGASQGSGTLNAEALYQNGQPVLTEVAKSLTQNGYLHLSNGFIIQWGTLPGVLAAPTIGTFPITFPNAARTITAVVKDGLNRNKPVDAFINSPSQFQFQINTGTGMKVGWIAIGH